MKKVSLLLVPVMAVALFGCASNQLTLRLDIYNEDPSVVRPTEAEIKFYQSALDLSEREGSQFASDRIAFAKDVFNLNNSLQTLAERITGHPAPEIAKKNQQRYLDDYKKAVEKKRADLSADIKRSRALLYEYSRRFSSGSRPISPGLADEKLAKDINALLHQVANDMGELAQPLGTDFEKTFLSDLANMTAVLSPENLKEFAGHKAEFESLRSQLRRLQDTADELAKRGSASMEFASRQLKEATENLEQAPTKAADALKTLPLSPSLTAEAREAQHQLTFQTDFNDLERLQDPTDPMWRILSSPENSRHWNTAFATNYFYAEGNSSVTVVRDTPINFRVQRGNNNPSALIQSQLQISRSIADAAIEIAGSATGVKLSLPEKNPDGSSTNQVIDVSMKQAQLDKEAALRSQALKDLQRKLAALRDQFTKSGTNDQQRTNLLVELQGLLKGEALIFKPDNIK